MTRRNHFTPDINLMRPRVLDLYCGQGGASVGYYLAGFDVIGVDDAPQPQYPFPFIDRHPVNVLADDGILDSFDLIHGPRELLSGRTGIPWVAETNIAAPGSIVLCGTHFNLGAPGRALRRHRRFTASFYLPDPGPCWCTRDAIDMSPGAMGIDWMSRTGLDTAIPPDYTRWIAEQAARRFFPELVSRDHQHERYSSGRIERFANL